MTISIGKTLNKQYFLRSLVGTGATSDVYLAWDSLRATQVAIKVLHPRLASNQRFHQIFKKEAEILGNLSHPNIVPVYEFGRDDDVSFIVMAWVDGIDLKKYFVNLGRQLELIEIVQILRPICNALSFSHQNGVFHCDVKPSNILLNKNGIDVFLADFGTARVSYDLVGGGGTPVYMAPEQFVGGEVGPWTDIYSIGIMTFEMLSGGELPFHGGTKAPGALQRERIAWEHLNRPLPSLFTYNSKVSSSVVKVVQKALNKNISDRFGSALEFLNAFEQAQNDSVLAESQQLINSRLIDKDETMKFCPDHGPYDASLDKCPYPHVPVTDFGNRSDSVAVGGFCPEHGPYEESSCPYPHMGKNYKIRVFVSSTYEDLKEYREVAFKAIHNLFGYSDDMLFWSADERDAATVSLERVKQCDVVILILAHRYGYVPFGEKYSITEMEYRAAKAASIPVLAFLLDNQTPWLISYVETEKREELKKFKDLVEKEVVRKTFKSKDELYALVTQAFHHFIERHRGELVSRKSFRGTLLAKSYAELSSKSDVLVTIGQSDDDLPLALNIKRSKDMQSRFNDLANLVSTHPSDNSAEEILNNFRFALEKHAASAWAGHRVLDVKMKSGTSEEMYVTNKNLSELTSSLLSRILRSAKRTIITENATEIPEVSRPRLAMLADEDESPTDLGYDKDEYAKEDTGQVVSFGGVNRFLGISVRDGQVYSVGKDLSNQWVEWHSFEFESINKNFPKCKFKINRLGEIPFSSYHSKLEEFCLENIDQEGFLADTITAILPRQSIGQVVVNIASAVAKLHAQGKIHGDLKPSNILLTKSGPTLIDDFNLRPGDRAPGWTPVWSAPEQVMREPITYAADIYSLGVFVIRFLSGNLVGEVRKFKVPDVRNRVREHDVFYNPSIFIQDLEALFNDGASQWIAFTKSCVKFDSHSRPKSADHFAGQLAELLEKYPVQGNVNLDLSKNGQIAAVTLIDGSKKVARVLSDY